MFRIKIRRRRPDPCHAAGYDVAHGFDRMFLVENAAADECPAGLVIMLLSWFDDNDIKGGAAFQQARRRGNTGRAAANDHNFMVRRTGWGFLFCCPALGFGAGGPFLKAWPVGREIVTGRSAGAENGIHIQMGRLGEGP